MRKLLFFWRELTSTFWFIPILIIAVSVVLSVSAIYIDSMIDFEIKGTLQYIFEGSASSARTILSIISAAMIGVAGTVFSITLVTLSLASSQFGTRLLRNFMHEKINQVVLGTYISTFVYCLVVLNSINDTQEIVFVPTLSVLMAIFIAIANIILLVIFIHHIAISIQSDKVISDISDSLMTNIRVLYPEGMGEEPETVMIADVESQKKTYRYMQEIKAPKNGYLQYIDSENIFKASCRDGQLVILNCKPGDYLVKDMNVFEVYSNKKPGSYELGKLQDTLIAGKVRTPHQDAEFSIRQMVEIAVRALSPGINDPYTAIACIDNLIATMCYLTGVKFPSEYRYDEEGNLRVVAVTLTFEGLMDVAFNQIRQFSAGSPSVVIRLMEAMVTINNFARTGNLKKVAQKHAQMVFRLAEKHFEEQEDLDDLRGRSKQILADH